jgi:hypothetical protein
MNFQKSKMPSGRMAQEITGLLVAAKNKKDKLLGEYAVDKVWQIRHN